MHFRFFRHRNPLILFCCFTPLLHIPLPLSSPLPRLFSLSSRLICLLPAGVWDVSNDALARHEYTGMWKLTLLCGCVQLLGTSHHTVILVSRCAIRLLHSTLMSLYCANCILSVVFCTILILYNTYMHICAHTHTHSFLHSLSL